MWQPRSTTERLDEFERLLARLFGHPDSGQESEHHILRYLANMEKRLMAAIDDLKSAIADLASELADNNAEIEALLVKISTPGTSEADIVAATQSIRDLIASNKAEVDKAAASVA